MKLRIKLIIPLIFLLVITAGTFHVYVIPSIIHEIEDELRTSEVHVVDALQSAVISYLLTDDYSELYRLLDQQKRLNPRWMAVYVFDEYGQLIYPLSQRPKPSGERNEFVISTVGNLEYQGSPKGTIELHSNIQPELRKKSAAIYQASNILLLIFAVLIGFIAWLQDRALNRPIRHITQSVHQMLNRNFEFQIPDFGQDEIGELAAGMNSMRHSIIDYQKSLAAESHQIHELLDNLEDAIITFLPDQTLVDANTTACNLFGVSRYELTNLKLGNILSNLKDQDSIKDMLATLAQGDVVSTRNETVLKRRRGQTIDIEYTFNSIVQQDKTIVVGVFRDITSRKANEREILNQRQQIVTINQAQANFITSGDPMQLFDGLLPDLLELTQSEYGFIGEVVHKPDDDIFLRVYTNCVFPWSELTNMIYVGEGSSVLEIHEFSPILQKIILKGEIVLENQELESSCIQTNQATYMLSAFLGMPLHFGDEVVGVLAVANRPTGYDKSTIQLLEPVLNTCSHLLDAVAKATERKKAQRDLLRAKEEAEAATQAKSEFLATMSHELRTPLNGMLGMMHLLGETELKDRQRGYIKTAVASGEMLLTVINDILDFSKIEADRLHLESIPISISAIVNQLVELFLPTASQKNTKLTFTVSNEVPDMILGDPTRLRQVLANLLSNAIKFTSDGDVSIKVQCLNDYLSFEVSDTGIGISHEQQSKLFKAFSQVDSSHTRRFGGTGLGLVISQKLVNAMGGQISVLSEPGSGSKFSFIIPMESIDCTSEPQPYMSFLSDLKILIIGQHRYFQAVLFPLLRGWNVRTIHHAFNPLDTLRNLIETESGNIIGERFELIIVHETPLSDETEIQALLVRLLEQCQTNIITIQENLNQTSTAIEMLEELAPSRLAKLNIKSKQADIFNAIYRLFGSAATLEDLKSGEKKNYWFREQSLLLVEDNVINQNVASEILNAVGFSLDICNNGAEAVAAVQEKDYAIILMDIQMPIMDGLEATRTIRDLGGHYRDIPIIAMTAHATHDDTLNSLKAGMNAHVTKPFNPDRLFSLLANFVDSTHKPSRKSLHNTTPDLECSISLDGIDVEDGLSRLNGNWKVYKDILSNFLERFGHADSELETAIGNQDWEKASALAHSLKGSSGNIGAKHLFQSSANLETAFKSKSVDNMPELLNKVKHELNRILAAIGTLKSEENQDKTETKHQISSVDLREKLDTLKSSLDVNLVESEAILEHIETYELDTEWSAIVAELRSALSDFDLDRAKDIIQKSCA